MITNKNDLPALLRNDTASAHHWLALRTRGVQSNRDGIGARVRLVAGGWQQMREVRAGASYLSHHSLWLSFGLERQAVVDTLEIRWPGGAVDTHVEVVADHFVIAEEGRELVEVKR